MATLTRGTGVLKRNTSHAAGHDVGHSQQRPVKAVSGKRVQPRVKKTSVSAKLLEGTLTDESSRNSNAFEAACASQFL